VALHAYTVASGCGDWTVIVDADGAVVKLTNAAGARSGNTDAGPAAAAVAQLSEYFAGSRRSFDLRLAPRGSRFQRDVWDELLKIPYGTTVAYSEVARRMGLDPRTTSRAIGLANGSNPIAILIPCHRVIGANGSLTGYGGGLPAKRWLLEHEGALSQGQLFES
jgi:methylated-DNA-[protein]-cysteine S-methyltransferase